jgi:hypothetical protein
MEAESSTLTLSTLCPLMTISRTIRHPFAFDPSPKFCSVASDDVSLKIAT